MTGAKYDAKPLVTSMREGFESAGVNSEDVMIHGALMPGRPATAIVSTLSSERPLRPYIFRSYQLPPGVKGLFEGQCRYSWLDALRASSAAPYFFEEFSLGASLRFQDGAIVANNPSIVALQEAQRLWPGRPVDCVVSVGTGKCPPEMSEARSMYSPLSMMVEAAISTERVAEAVETLAPLIPGASFFRLQVEDRRMAAEIDDISSDVRTGLCAAVAEYIQDNDVLFQEIALALDEAPTRQSAGEGELEQAAGADDVRNPGCAQRSSEGAEPGRAAKKTKRKMGMGAGIQVAVVESLGGCGEGLFYPRQHAALDAPTGSAQGGASQLVVHLQQEMGLSAELLSVSASMCTAAIASSAAQSQSVLPAVIEGLARTRANVVHFEGAVRDEGLIATWQRSPLVISLSEALSEIKSASAHSLSHPQSSMQYGPNSNETPHKLGAVDFECPASPFAGPSRQQTKPSRDVDAANKGMRTSSSNSLHSSPLAGPVHRAHKSPHAMMRSEALAEMAEMKLTDAHGTPSPGRCKRQVEGGAVDWTEGTQAEEAGDVGLMHGGQGNSEEMALLSMLQQCR